MTQLASDDFERAALGANWSTISGEFAWFITGSSDATANGSDSSSNYSAIDWPDDQWAEATFSAIPIPASAGAGAGVATRCDPTNSARTYYRHLAGANGANDSCIGKLVGGSYTQLALASNQGWVNGDVVRGEAQGTDIRLLRNGTQVLSASDSAIAGGDPGLTFSTSTTGDPQFEDWAAGDFATANAPTKRSHGFKLQQMADAEDDGKFNELDVRNWWCEAFA